MEDSLSMLPGCDVKWRIDAMSSGGFTAHAPRLQTAEMANHGQRRPSGGDWSQRWTQQIKKPPQSRLRGGLRRARERKTGKLAAPTVRIFKMAVGGKSRSPQSRFNEVGREKTGRLDRNGATPCRSVGHRRSLAVAQSSSRYNDSARKPKNPDS